jgi:hypothetical protein
MNRKKHESSLLEVFSDAGSTPAASTIFYVSDYRYLMPRNMGTRFRPMSDFPKLPRTLKSYRGIGSRESSLRTTGVPQVSRRPTGMFPILKGALQEHRFFFAIVDLT